MSKQRDGDAGGATRRDGDAGGPARRIGDTQSDSQLPRAARRAGRTIDERLAVEDTAPLSDDQMLPTVDAEVRSGAIEIGSRIDRFVILEVLGRGGCGVVYAAHDPDLDRKVALKFVHADVGSSDSSGTSARLLREAQALARLSHRNVVAVYDIGRHGDDVYLAEELVPGRTLRAWLAERKRPWREVLEVFLQAGRGLAAAHAAGVVHRDFKPDNVLVSETGQVLVTDFGLARSGGDAQDLPRVDEDEKSLTASNNLDTPLTRTGAVVGTPAYMAPEQFRGEPTDARSDLFSFCVALYEALYGERPFPGDNIGALRRAVESGTRRSLPAAVRVPAHIQRALTRGLEVRSEDRPATLADLLDELERDPWAARKRLLLAAGVLVLVAGAVAGGYALRSHDSARCTGAEARLASVWDDASRERVRAAIFDTKQAYADAAWTRVRAHLDDYAAAWVEAHRDACEASNVRGEQSAEMLDLRMSCLDARRADLLAAVQVLEATTAESLDAVLDVARGLPSLAACSDTAQLRARSPLPVDPAARERIDYLHGEVARANALTKAGKYKDALEAAQSAADQAMKIDYPPLRAEALMVRGEAEQTLGKYEKARDTLHQAWEEAVEGGDDEQIVRALSNLVLVLGHNLSRYQEALEVARLAKGALVRWGRGRGGEAMVLHNTAVVLRDSGDADGALEMLQKARELAGKDEPPILDVYQIINAIASIQYGRGEIDKARAGFEEVLRGQTETLGELHPEVATTLNNLGSVAASTGDYKSARSYFERTLALREKTLGPDHPNLLIPLYNLGLLCTLTDEPEAARSYLERAVAVSEKAHGPNSEQTAIYRAALAEHLLNVPDGATEALAVAKRALAIHEQAKTADTPDVAWLLQIAGRAYRMTGSPEQAWPLAERAYAICSEKSCDVRVRGQVAFELARSLWDANRTRGRAAALAREARKAFDTLGDSESVDGIDAWLGKHRP